MINDFCWEIPSTIDLEKLLKNHSPDFSYKKDHFYYIIDYLWNAMVYNDLDDIGGFINLNAAMLQKQNHNYKKYLKYLMKHRLLSTDMEYIVGKKSFGYRLNFSDSEDLEIIRIPIQDLTIKRKRIREQHERNSSFLKTKKSYPFLFKWYNDLLEIDAVRVDIPS